MGRFFDVRGDEEILTILDLIEGEGKTMAEVAALMGGSRSGIAGILLRVRKDLDAADAQRFAVGCGPAVRPENQDGGMDRGWWRAGLARRKRGIP